MSYSRDLDSCSISSLYLINLRFGSAHKHTHMNVYKFYNYQYTFVIIIIYNLNDFLRISLYIFFMKTNCVDWRDPK